MTWLFFCRLLMCVPYFCQKKKFFADECTRVRIVWIVTSKTFCTLIPRWVFLRLSHLVAYIHSGSLLLVLEMIDSRDGEMSMTFSKDKFAFSLSKLCCARSWFIPHTKRSLKIESKESLYSQY